jgi:transposase
MTVIGEDSSERLDVIPAQFRVIVTRRGCVHEFWPTCADEYWPTLRGLMCYAGPDRA